MPNISRDIQAVIPGLIELRRDLHRHPELGFQLGADVDALPIQTGSGTQEVDMTPRRGLP